MELSLYKELLLLGVIFTFSVIGGITGIGIATIVIPLLILLGGSLPFVKATALWVNVSIMSYSVFRRRRLIKWSLALPLVVTAYTQHTAQKAGNRTDRGADLYKSETGKPAYAGFRF